jgi:hypothetical protein
MAVSLRDVLDENLNIDTVDLITDDILQRHYNKAVNFYSKYRLFPRTNTCNYSIETGAFVPTVLLDELVDVDGVPTKLADLVDTKTHRFNGTGSVTVIVALTSDNAYLTGLPTELENLFVAYCKKLIGQRLKFAKYPNQPIELDGEALYTEGVQEITQWETFLMINRDERPENKTDLREEAHRGSVRLFKGPGNFLF